MPARLAIWLVGMRSVSARRTRSTPGPGAVTTCATGAMALHEIRVEVVDQHLEVRRIDGLHLHRARLQVHLNPFEHHLVVLLPVRGGIAPAQHAAAARYRLQLRVFGQESRCAARWRGSLRTRPWRSCSRRWRRCRRLRAPRSRKGSRPHRARRCTCRAPRHAFRMRFSWFRLSSVGVWESVTHFHCATASRRGRLRDATCDARAIAARDPGKTLMWVASAPSAGNARRRPPASGAA